MDTCTPNRAEITPAVALDPAKLSNAVRAVAYVRMSTDQQELSIGTQLETISRYAEGNQMRLVRVYEDAAKSGLQIGNRSAMKQLLRDVMDEPRDFDVVLVNDVSRWGRFQDSDAAAYYEYTCRLHGAEVIYVSVTCSAFSVQSFL